MVEECNKNKEVANEAIAKSVSNVLGTLNVKCEWELL